MGRAVPSGVRFDADSFITRTEAFVILGRLLDTYAPDSVLHRFSDHAEIPGWARPEIARLVGQGLLTGTGDGRLLPLNNITRAESIATLARIAPNILSIDEASEAIEDDDLFERPDLEEQAPPEEEVDLDEPEPESEDDDLEPGLEPESEE